MKHSEIVGPRSTQDPGPVCPECGSNVDQDRGVRRADLLLYLDGTAAASAAQVVADAWTVEGSNPAYHKAQVLHLQKKWPTLFNAVRGLVAVFEGQGRIKK